MGFMLCPRCGRRGLVAVAAVAVAGLRPAAGYPAAPGGDPDHQVDIPGLGRPVFLGGGGIHVEDGTKLSMQRDSGASFASTCHPTWRPEDIVQFKLLGKTISFDVDLSRVGCACNLAFYLVGAPARDEEGNPIPGDNMLAPSNFYCDANKVGGQWCPEVDIMEANTHAFASTPHKCDSPHNSHYDNCDRGGCGQNTRDMPNTYGPGPGFKINTMRPFKVLTAFTANGNQLTSMVTTLEQDANRVTLDHGACTPEYYASLSPSMASGMSLRITYWGNAASAMAWLDSPPCGSQTCTGANTGLATISDIRVDRSTGASVGGEDVQVSNAQGLASGGYDLSSHGYDCVEGIATWESGWSVEKQTWCCEEEGVACESFNCFEDIKNWGMYWSVRKKAWCCKHHFQGCPESPGAPGAGAREQIGLLRWSNHPEKCLTATGGASRTLAIADCAGEFGSAAQVWESIDGMIRLHFMPNECVAVEDEKAENGARVVVTACEPKSPQQGFSIDAASAKIHWKADRHMCLDVTDHKALAGTPLQIWECLHTDLDQVFAWPVMDKAALLEAQNRTAAPEAGSAHATTRSPSGDPQRLTTTPEPFECSLPDLSTTPYRQRFWCCSYKRRGCPVVIPQWWRYDPPVPYAIHTGLTPEIKGARTEHMLHPGDVFEVQTAKWGLDGILYLNLTGGRGWTSESKPGIGTICAEHYSQKFSQVPGSIPSVQGAAASPQALAAWLAGVFAVLGAGVFALFYCSGRPPQRGAAVPILGGAEQADTPRGAEAAPILGGAGQAAGPKAAE